MQNPDDNITDLPNITSYDDPLPPSPPPPSDAQNLGITPSFIPNLEFTELPRYELREEQFRKYEPYLARSFQQAVVTLNPREECKKWNRTKLSAHTLALRLKDAILAYKRFKYSSTSIPSGVDLSILKVSETIGGLVVIRNLILENKSQHSMLNALAASNRDLIISSLNSIRDQDIGPNTKHYFISYSTDEEKQFVLSIVGKEMGLVYDEVRPGLLKVY